LPALAVLLMTMSDKRSKAFDFAADVAKQFITLGTGILALTITFAKDIGGGPSRGAPLLLGVSWVLYLLSILAGVWTLMALTGELEPIGSAESPSIRRSNVVTPAFAQIASFVVATGLVIAYAFGVIVLA
jgi:hypothetical protein